MSITEEQLQMMGVSEGASHKLVLCVEKLKNRKKQLINMKHDLINGHYQLSMLLNDLSDMVLTPMKPINWIKQQQQKRQDQQQQQTPNTASDETNEEGENKQQQQLTDDEQVAIWFIDVVFLGKEKRNSYLTLCLKLPSC